MKINLPCIIPVDDYHEFSYLEEKFRKIISEFKFREVGYGYEGYLGVAYIGNMNSPENKKIFQECKKMVRVFEENEIVRTNW